MSRVCADCGAEYFAGERYHQCENVSIGRVEVTCRLATEKRTVKSPYVGAIVLYRPDKTSDRFHDRGFCPRLPAIITKVWSSGAANLRVADEPVGDDGKVDIKVFLDHNGKDQASFVWVFGSTYGDGMDQWTWPKETV